LILNFSCSAYIYLGMWLETSSSSYILKINTVDNLRQYLRILMYIYPFEVKTNNFVKDSIRKEKIEINDYYLIFFGL